MSDALMGVFGRVKPQPKTQQPVAPVVQQPQTIQITPAMASKAQALAYGAGQAPLGGGGGKVRSPMPKADSGVVGASKQGGWGGIS